MSKDDNKNTPQEALSTLSIASVSKDLTQVRAVDKDQFYKFLGLSMDKYDNVPMDAETAERYRNHIISLRTGLHAVVPLICAGPKCPVIHKCPLVVKDPTTNQTDFNSTHFPLARACPVEREILQLHIMDLVKEFEINPENTTDLAIVTKIATLDIYDYRASALLAKDEAGSLLREETIGQDPITKEEFTTLKIHPAFDLKEKIHRMRQDLLKSMVATRKDKIDARAKLKQGDEGWQTDVAKTMSELSEKIQKLEALDVEYEELSVFDDE